MEFAITRIVKKLSAAILLSASLAGCVQLGQSPENTNAAAGSSASSWLSAPNGWRTESSSDYGDKLDPNPVIYFKPTESGGSASILALSAELQVWESAKEASTILASMNKIVTQPGSTARRYVFISQRAGISTYQKTNGDLPTWAYTGHWAKGRCLLFISQTANTATGISDDSFIAITKEMLSSLKLPSYCQF